MASLMARIREMVAAHAHHGLDRVENPDVMAQQVLRDLTEDIQAAQRALVVALGAHKRLAKERDRLHEDATGWDAKAGALLRAGDERLAREALQRAVTARAQAKARERPLASAQQAAQRVRQQIDQLKRELAEAQIRAAEIRACLTAGEAAGVALRFRDHYGRAMARAQKLDRLAQKAGSLEAEAAAAAELVEEAHSLDREAERVTVAAEVDAAMATLKARVQADGTSSRPTNE
ncbi:PspA/IM30 family protein [Sinimarinibacterium thermocellulolyticum]|uniref:PspA/IM30 family protein n=1 Tax=Sinimarinibacterium thermocellulolyticum TaxID=3170016 RepID=A0ABV2A9B4_9GAMM